MAWIDWDAVIAALDGGRLPHPAGRSASRASRPATLSSLRDAIPGIDQRSLDLVTAPSATPPGSASEPQPGRGRRHGYLQPPGDLF
jgi:hypothetical protein